MNIKLYLKIIFGLILIGFLILVITILFLKNNDALKITPNNVIDNEVDDNIVSEKDDNVVNKKVIITINDEEYSVSLEDNETVDAFLKILPLVINMSELNGNEKYYFLNHSLPSNPKFIEKINSGDIMLYGDNCIVIFYETFKTTYNYTKIGRIDNSNELKNKLGTGTVKVKIISE